MGRCYVKGISQVSCQGALTYEWFWNPKTGFHGYARAVEPDVKGLVSPAEARRMSRILKRTVATSFDALQKAGVEQPDAIITGTGNGCVENSEKFLTDMALNGESCLKPTLFMQSTHNTISSLIAILLRNHGYNNTYSHRGISFESALLDAWLQMKGGSLHTALVGAHDEVTPLLYKVVRKAFPQYGFVSEASVSVVLGEDADNSICEVKDVRIFHKPSVSEIVEYLDSDRKSLLMLGVNSNDANDGKYEPILSSMGHSAAILRYKNIFGDGFSASALGFYAAVMILQNRSVPDYMILREKEKELESEDIESVTLLNYSPSDDWGIIRLGSVRMSEK